MKATLEPLTEDALTNAWYCNELAVTMHVAVAPRGEFAPTLSVALAQPAE